MTHVAGHVETKGKSFGILRPTYLDQEGNVAKKLANIELLYLGCEGGPDKGKLVAFHPYLIPWCDNKYLFIAGDVVSYNDHQNAEKELKDKEYKKVEDWGINLNVKSLRRIIKEIGNEKNRKLLEASCNYMETESFKRLYKDNSNAYEKGIGFNNNIVDWIFKNGVHLQHTGITELHYSKIIFDADFAPETASGILK